MADALNLDALKRKYAEVDPLTNDEECYQRDMLALIAYARELEHDAARLDFLDGMNARLNSRYGTSYGWELILSAQITRLMSGPGGPGCIAAIDLNDSKARGAASCRAAIDAARGGKGNA